MSGPQKIRVLIIAPASPLVGGQAVQAQRLIDKFKEVGTIEAELLPINPRFFPSLQKIKYLRTLLTSIRYVAGLISKVSRFDVIHVFSASFMSFLLAPAPAILVSKLFRKPVLLNYRSGFLETHLRSSPRAAIALLKRCDLVVTPSRYLGEVFKKFGIESRHVFNFVETDIFRYRKRERFQPKFLSNRSFEDLYNVECTIRAFSLIQRELPEASLTVAGGGSLEKELKELAMELGLVNVEFTGQVSQAEMAELYDRCDIYLNSPEVDNMPSSILEAFASGTAVVSTDAGGIPYIVEHERNGLLVGCGDYGALSTQALRLLRDPGLAQSLTASAFSDLERYSWEPIRDEWLKLYEALAAKSGP